MKCEHIRSEWSSNLNKTLEIRQRINILQERIAAACGRAGRPADSVRVIAVTKTHSAETVQAVIDAGIADIGENRVQEIREKAPLLTGTPCLHMIGHLQTNKVAKAVPLVHWIQSIDSVHLLEKVENACRSAGTKLNVLVQVNTSGEQSKSGCAPAEALRLCERAAQSDAVAFQGLMTIGPLGGGERETRNAFITLRNLGEQCKGLAGKIELSMGMSGDFEWAIEEGATMVRIGSLLFGERTT